jgi:hypothetical protein
MPEPPTIPPSPHDQPTLALPPGAVEQAVAADALPVLQRFGCYELIQELGRGGMSVVFKARETELNRFVAVKMLLPGALADAAELQRFKVEAEAAACLQHPNIVSVHGVGVQDGRHYYSMDFIDGMTLSQRLAKAPLPNHTAARYLLSIARAIDHAHKHGILHRDLKPANVLLDGEDQPHVADFGLAKQLRAGQGNTRTGSILGTPSYMSPEQAAGRKDLGPACDVYGLGALLYEMLTGRPPFQADTPLETVMRVLEHDAAPPRSLNPKADRELEIMCLKCLNKEPAHRYAAASAVAEDLERWLRGEAIHARSFGVIDRLVWTLEHSQYDVEFGPYGLMLYWFAVIVGLTHGAKYLFIQFPSDATPAAILVLQTLQFVLMGVVFYRFRKGGVMPATAAERQLWSVWIAYLIASLVVGFVCYYLRGLKEGLLVQYPFFAVNAGAAFFTLGSFYWGRCYALGVAFFALACLMPIHLEWAPLEFGLMWTACLVLLGRRLRRLARERAESGKSAAK